MRTFIGVALNDATRHKLVRLQQQFSQSGSKVKWVEPENLHVTMLFLGEVDAREVLDVCKAVGRVTIKLPAFSMSVAGVGGFPNLRRPRTLWIGIDEGAQELIRLHDDMEGELLKLGCYRREDRQYTPHVTLGRVRGDDLTPELRDALAQHADWRAGTMNVNDVHVLSSELTAEGPVYTVLSREKLRGGD
jgi:2'-5' RNA ligase